MTSSTNDPFDKIATRIATFIRLLSSNQDGEVLAAVSAMIRTLRAAGVDIHALAQRVEAKGLDLSKAEMQKLFDAGHAAGHAAGYAQAMAEVEGQKQSLRFQDIDATAFHAMAVYCKRNYRGSNEREREFINHMVAWTKRREPTEKQQVWLEDIYARLGGK